MNNYRFGRMEMLVGKERFTRLSDASVTIFGIGGVGSYAAEALARAGVGQLTLVDFDDICLTNTNRQIHALSDTIGMAKVQAMAERCRKISPDIQVEAVKEFYQAGQEDLLLKAPVDYVLDCIDHITAKLHLIETCVARQIPIISSMGAANKLDPSLIRVADIAKTEKCRLARVIRKELRRRDINSGVKVVYSLEEFRELSDANTACGDTCVCPNKEDQQWSCEDRRTILGSSSYIPPIFGLTMAGEVIRSLIGEA